MHRQLRAVQEEAVDSRRQAAPKADRQVQAPGLVRDGLRRVPARQDVQVHPEPGRADRRAEGGLARLLRADRRRRVAQQLMNKTPCPK